MSLIKTTVNTTLKTIIVLAALVGSSIFFVTPSATASQEGSFKPFASGGPDAYGYRWYDSNPPAPQEPFSWDDISTTGTDIGAHSDDGEFGPFPIGFSFEFYGQTYVEFWIGNNGGVLFSSRDLPYTNGRIPSYGAPYAAVLPFWDDLYTAGYIYYQTKGTAPNRELIVQWQDINHYSYTGGTITFQVILYETSNNIKFQYLDVNFGNPTYDAGASATVGIQCENATIGLEYSYNSPVLSNNLAIRFTYEPPTLNITATANPYVIEEHGTSRIEITVLNYAGALVQGATVELSCNIGTLSNPIGTTGVYGNFSTTYTAPSVAVQTKCTIIINATALPNSGKTFLNLTILPLSQALLHATCSASPAVVYAANTSAISVQVNDQSGAPVGGANVYINVTTGSVAPAVNVTNSAGGCSAVYTAPMVAKDTLCVLNLTVVLASYRTGYSEIQLVIKPPPPLFVSAYALPSMINATENSTIKVIVTDGVGGAAYATVTLSSSIGGSFTPPTGLTDLTGNFTTIYTAPLVYTQSIDTITVSASKAGHSAAVTQLQITVNPILTIIVSMPNGGERWYVGRQYNIDWSTAGATGPVEVKLDFSTDGGHTYQNIADYLPASGPYAWTIPQVPSSTNCYIRATATDTTTHQVAVDTNDAPFEIVAVQFATIWYDGFEIHRGWTGYYTGTSPNDPGEWERAIPQGSGTTPDDPDRAYNGSYVIGNDLTGLGRNIRLYENGLTGTYWLTSPAIDCTGYTGVVLKFQRWLGVYYPYYDHVYLEVSNDSTSWDTVWTATGWAAIYDGAWVEQVYDISSVADNQPRVYIRFGIGPTGSYTTYCGWNIDDLIIEGVPEAPIPIISAPNGGEVWYQNSTYSINWTILSNTGTPSYNVDLYISTDNGQRWSTIVTGLRQSTAGDGNYLWQIRGVPASLDCMVRIVVTDSRGKIGQDTSNSNFEIRIPPLSVLVVAPNGGEKWYTGKTYKIVWRTEGGVSPYSVDLQLTISGGPPTVIGSATQSSAGTGTYDWAIPATQIASPNCRIIVKVRDSSIGGSVVEDSSDGDFEIAVSPISVLLNHPTGGEVWYIGEVHTINWTVTGGAPSYEIKIELSTDGGLNWQEITTAWQYTEGRGEFDWTVAGNVSKHCIVRITATDRLFQTKSAESAKLAIYAMPKVTVLAPNGGETYYVGVSYQICWSVESGVEPYGVDIYISTDGGANYILLGRMMQQTEGINTYLWDVNLTQVTISDVCGIKIKVTDATLKTALDVSDNFFAIALPEPVVKLTSPVGGEEWSVDNAYQITWHVKNGTPPYEITVQLSTDGGATYLYVITAKTQLIAGTGSYSWRIDSPTYVSDRCVIKITLKDANKKVSASVSGRFTIKMELVVEYGTLVGTVLDATTNVPLQGVTIEVRYAANGTLLYTTYTHADGNYTVRAPPGLYNLNFSRYDYKSKEITYIRVIANKVRPVPTVKLEPIEKAREERKPPVEQGTNVFVIFGAAGAVVAVVFVVIILILRKREKGGHYYQPYPTYPTVPPQAPAPMPRMPSR